MKIVLPHSVIERSRMSMGHLRGAITDAEMTDAINAAFAEMERFGMIQQSTLHCANKEGLDPNSKYKDLYPWSAFPAQKGSEGIEPCLIVRLKKP